MNNEQIAAKLLEIANFYKSQNDPYAELKAAHKAGKVIEFKPKVGNLPWITDSFPEWADHMEYRIKPEPAFTLPPCAPGMEWHRPDGWKPEDLPQGWRPLTHGEIVQKNDEVKNANLDGDCFIAALGSIGWEVGYTHKNQYCRTRRPLIFTHAGKQWTWHRPGDPMPCDGEARIEIICEGGKTVDLNGDPLFPRRARVNIWEKTLGWRYADETKTVPLGPENVPPGSVFRGAGEAKDSSDKGWCLITSCSKTGIRYWRNSDRDPVELTWESLRSLDSQINRSIPLTGRWDPSAWEPCSKEVKA